MIKTYEVLKLKTGVIISATNTSGSQKVDAIMELFTQSQKVEVGEAVPIQTVDERTTNKELFHFLISKNKPIKINDLKTILNEYDKEEISLSRFQEKLNEIVYYWNKNQPQKVEVREAVEFAEWILKEAVLPRDTNWFDAGNYYTSDGLYKLFKDTK